MLGVHQIEFRSCYIFLVDYNPSVVTLIPRIISRRWSFIRYFAGGVDKLFVEQDLGGAVLPEDEDMFLVPGAKDLPQAMGLAVEDNSQLLKWVIMITLMC